MKTIQQNDTHHRQVQEHYAAIARAPDRKGCGCAPECCSTGSRGLDLGYTTEDLADAPADSNLNLGCGNPLALASLRDGDTVLDLGSGAGFDCFIAARRLHGTGRVIGVDMTPEMIAKARGNAERAGHTNVDFRLGHIEALPVEDDEVDLVISNCVINLSPDKPAVFREAFRVLKHGGTLSVSDIVARGNLPASWRDDPGLIAACLAGAEKSEDIHAWLVAAGFTDIRIEPKDIRMSESDLPEDLARLGEILFSAIISATKP